MDRVRFPGKPHTCDTAEPSMPARMSRNVEIAAQKRIERNLA
jgi:hypothetical protein